MKKYQSKNFNIEIQHLPEKIMLIQQVSHPAIVTEHLPATPVVLGKMIPTIFENECYNDKNLPFKQEVLATQVGHLFEHLILEKIKLDTVKKYGSADIRGETSWDWLREAYGKYHITIHHPHAQRSIFDGAFLNAVVILERIYQQSSADVN